MTIRSPLGAMGAVVVLIQAISAGALFAVKTQFALQLALVILLIITTLSFVGLVLWMVIYLVKHRPALLFNPEDIDPSIHREIYVEKPENIEAKLDKV